MKLLVPTVLLALTAALTLAASASAKTYVFDAGKTHVRVNLSQGKAHYRLKSDCGRERGGFRIDRRRRGVYRGHDHAVRVRLIETARLARLRVHHRRGRCSDRIRIGAGLATAIENFSGTTSDGTAISFQLYSDSDGDVVSGLTYQLYGWCTKDETTESAVTDYGPYGDIPVDDGTFEVDIEDSWGGAWGAQGYIRNGRAEGSLYASNVNSNAAGEPDDNGSWVCSADSADIEFDASASD